MNILKTKYSENTYIQIYLTKEELENKETQEKINSLKCKNTKVAMFTSGTGNYSKILERIIILQVEK